AGGVCGALALVVVVGAAGQFAAVCGQFSGHSAAQSAAVAAGPGNSIVALCRVGCFAGRGGWLVLGAAALAYQYTVTLFALDAIAAAAVVGGLAAAGAPGRDCHGVVAGAGLAVVVVCTGTGAAAWCHADGCRAGAEYGLYQPAGDFVIRYRAAFLGTFRYRCRHRSAGIAAAWGADSDGYDCQPCRPGPRRWNRRHTAGIGGATAVGRGAVERFAGQCAAAAGLPSVRRRVESFV